MDPKVTNKLVIWKGAEVRWTSGIWLNESLNSNFPENHIYNFSYTSNEEERYLTYSVNEDVTSFPVLTISSGGGLLDDVGRDIPCSAFEGCANPNPFDLEDEKRWMSLVEVASVVPVLCYELYLLLKKLKAKVESMVIRQKLLCELGDKVSLPTIFGNGKAQASKDQTMKRDLVDF